MDVNPMDKFFILQINLSILEFGSAWPLRSMKPVPRAYTCVFINTIRHLVQGLSESPRGLVKTQDGESNPQSFQVRPENRIFEKHMGDTDV